MSQQATIVDLPPIPPSSNGSSNGRSWSYSEPRISPVAMARFGVVLFIAVEAMIFAGLISAFLTIRTSLVWPPLDQPRYPLEATAVNTAVLLASALTLYLFKRYWSKGGTSSRTLASLMIATVLLGSLFLVAQGIEWTRLVAHGLTVQSSTYGSIFYVIIGCHAVHVFGGLLWLGASAGHAVTNRFTRGAANLEASSLFWYFVVSVWPILYVVVYF